MLTDQASKFGELYVPLHIKNQIASEIAAVDAVNQELARRGITSDDPPPESDVQTIINHYRGTTFVGNRGVAIGGNASNTQISTGDNNRLTNDAPGYIENAESVRQDSSKLSSPNSAASVSLRTVIERLQIAATEAQQSGDEELGDSLQTAVIHLRDARRKIVEAQKILYTLHAMHPTVAPLVESIKQVIEY